MRISHDQLISSLRILSEFVKWFKPQIFASMAEFKSKSSLFKSIQNIFGILGGLPNGIVFCLWTV